MKKALLISAALAAVSALPCAAQLKDDASALTALNGNSARDRLNAITYFGAQRTPGAYDALCSRFRAEKDAYLRVQIVEAFDVQGSTLAYGCAVAAADDGNRAVRQAAAAALGPKAGDPAADIKLKALAADPSEIVRISVVNSLSVNTSTSAAAIIGGVLSDRKGTLRARRVAAITLSRMKSRAADDELLKHLSDADPQIKAAAMSRRPSR